MLFGFVERILSIFSSLFRLLFSLTILTADLYDALALRNCSRVEGVLFIHIVLNFLLSFLLACNSILGTRLGLVSATMLSSKKVLVSLAMLVKISLVHWIKTEKAAFEVRLHQACLTSSNWAPTISL